MNMEVSSLAFEDFFCLDGLIGAASNLVLVVFRSPFDLICGREDIWGTSGFLSMWGWGARGTGSSSSWIKGRHVKPCLSLYRRFFFFLSWKKTFHQSSLKILLVYQQTVGLASDHYKNRKSSRDFAELRTKIRLGNKIWLGYFGH